MAFGLHGFCLYMGHVLFSLSQAITSSSPPPCLWRPVILNSWGFNLVAYCLLVFKSWSINLFIKVGPQENKQTFIFDWSLSQSYLYFLEGTSEKVPSTCISAEQASANNFCMNKGVMWYSQQFLLKLFSLTHSSRPPPPGPSKLQFPTTKWWRKISMIWNLIHLFWVGQVQPRFFSIFVSNSLWN